MKILAQAHTLPPEEFKEYVLNAVNSVVEKRVESDHIQQQIEAEQSLIAEAEQRIRGLRTQYDKLNDPAFYNEAETLIHSLVESMVESALEEHASTEKDSQSP